MKNQFLLLFFLCSTLLFANPYILTDSDITIENGIIIDYHNTTEKDIEIPSTLNGQTVTSIGVYAFKDNTLTSVKIPNTVKSIEGYAFASNNLTSITVPDSVNYIGLASFFDNQLTSVTISKSVTSIDDYAFASNQLKSVSIPNLIFIGLSAFENNAALTNLEVQDIFEGLDKKNTFVTPVKTTISKDYVGLVELGPDNTPVLSINNETIKDVRVYPNPSDGHFSLDLVDQVPTNILIYDLTGKFITKLPNQTKQDVHISVSEGIYILHIVTETASKQVKLIIKH